MPNKVAMSVYALTRHCDNKGSDGSPCWRHLRWRHRVDAFSMATLLGTPCRCPVPLLVNDTDSSQSWKHPQRMSLYQRCSAGPRSVTVEASECSELIVMPDLSFVFLLETSQDDALRSLRDGHGQQHRHITMCRSSCSVSC